MTETTVLITSVSTKVLLVKEFKKALAEEEDEGKVIGIDIDPLSAALYFCDEYAICPRLDSPDYLNYIEKLCIEKKVRLIVATRDEDVLYLSKHKKHIENRTMAKVMVPDIEIAKICSDKFDFFRFLQEHDLPAIISWTEICDNITYPCALKSRSGAGARKFYIAKDKEDLSKLIGNIEDPIIQEYVEGTEYSIDYFSDFDGNYISLVPRVRIKVVSGESKIGITVNDQEINDLCISLATKMKLTGHNVIQCFRTALGDVKFIEVNPRFGGASNLSFAAGRSTPLYLIKLLNKNEIDVKPFKEGLKMLRYSEDIFIDAHDKSNNL
ncbi:ATP-grasp domain-containing protein [Methanolobus sp. ZRKC5]|uniref:ATP-grasp domain-containing protein n=1 Tax=unclassified Methanolobus TaxID=2629569 RepID=UPI00313CA62F